MTLLEAIESRHSVRQYEDKQIPEADIHTLQEKIDSCNKESGLHIQLVTNEPKAFDGMAAHYGTFSGVQNYIALIGTPAKDFEEKCGYYGEQIVLLAQTLNLNTCWVAMSFSKGTAKKSCTFEKGEKLCVVISLGYGKTQGAAHKAKSLEAVCADGSEKPEWFTRGVQAALLAPTAMNQQRFLFSFDGTDASAKATGGFFSKVDLGIVKCHFDIASGKTCR
jgi:hypothetical protein